MKVVAALVLSIVYQVWGSLLPVADSQDSALKLLGALKHLTEDLKVNRSELETKLKSLETVRLDLEHLNALEHFVNMTINSINHGWSLEGSGGLVSRPSKKYSVFNTTKGVNWISAKRLCEDRGLQLASVKSETDQKELERTIKSSGSEEIISRERLPHSVWIGGHRVNDNGEFVWSSSGRPFSYTNWKRTVQVGPYNCMVLLLFSSYKWMQSACYDLYNVYACEYAG